MGLDPVPAYPESPDRGLEALLGCLCCPGCAAPLRHERTRLACAAGHSFDIARQGYVNLVAGQTRHRGDTAGMVAARDRFLSRHHYRPLIDTVTVLAAHHDPDVPGTVVDLAGGTGRYLAAVLDRLPHRHGVCLEASTAALRRAARAHPRAGAIGADVWRRWPLVAESASIVLNVFAPRNRSEIRRVLAPGGILITATPTADHLRELIDPLGMTTVDPNKSERLAADLRGFAPLDAQLVTYRMGLDHEDARTLAGMGPTAHHVSEDELDRRVAGLPELTGVTFAVEVAVYRASSG
ncbi:putative RNA methyltransferase [Pseudonocardia asaccharolytica]|nr:23S rRNA methyltransferase [Pseudonocardia asaccharolytica]